jgi:mono/diheme cytochrome c family protein
LSTKKVAATARGTLFPYLGTAPQRRWVRATAAMALTVSTAVGPAAGADVNAGATLVQVNGCAGCHGATLHGGIGPSLVGIEHRRATARIAAAIATPTAPMPTLPFSATQIGDILAYLSSLDGGHAPVATVAFAQPATSAVLSVRFPGSPPTRVTAHPVMQMGSSAMDGTRVTLHPTNDPNLWRATIAFSMSGPWTIDVVYDGRHLSVPANVPGSP